MNFGTTRDNTIKCECVCVCVCVRGGEGGAEIPTADKKR